MGIDIQKQLDLHPYSDKNVVTKPAEQTQTVALQPVDEEKSNAAKWMIGLTATTAIVLGGLYAAKKGHLGEGAEKFAKKLFGESINEVKNNNTTPAAQATKTTLDETVASALAFATPAFIRGKIKNPKLKLNDFIQELENANLTFRKFEVTVPNPKTHVKLASGEGIEPWSFRFDKDGVLKSIRKKISDTEQTVYRFENNILSKIERKIPTPSGKPLEHIIELAQDGALKAKRFVLNDTLRELPLNSQLLKRIKSSEIVEAYIPRTSKYFKQAVKELEIVRVTAAKFGDESSINVNKLLRQFSDAHTSPKEAKFLEKNLCTPEKVTVTIQKMAGKNNAFGAEVLKLIQKDIKEMKSISIDTIKAMAKDYAIKLRANKITKPEHVAIVGKPIQECSYNEMLEILREVAPDKAGKLGVVQDPFKNKPQETKAILHTIKSLTGRSNINERTSLLEILQDL